MIWIEVAVQPPDKSEPIVLPGRTHAEKGSGMSASHIGPSARSGTQKWNQPKHQKVSHTGSRCRTHRLMFKADLPMPPTENDYYIPVPIIKAGRRPTARLVLGKKGKDYAKTIGELVMEARCKQGWPQFLTDRVGLRIEVHFSNYRVQDISNRVKPLEDAITKSGLWTDDQQVDALIVLRGEVRQIACVAVCVWALANSPISVQERLDLGNEALLDRAPF